MTRRSSDTMRKNTQSGADAAADESYESFGGAQIERMASGASKAPREAAHLGLERPLIAPSWMKRLSTRGKLSRALVVALALLVALLVVLPRSTITLPPGIARLLTPAPTQTPQPGHFTVGQWEQVSGPPVQTTDYYDLLASPVDPLTAYTCTLPVPSDPTSPYSARPATVWVTHDAGVRWGAASLPPISGTGCEASPAQDGSHRVTLSVTDDTRDQNAQACGHSQYYLSEDDGATWRRIGPTVAEKTLGAEPVGVLVTESNLGGGPRACHCLFAFSFTPTGGASMGRLFMSHDATHSH
jgi:hypothetical protein